MAPEIRPFRYLNEDGAWPRFHWNALALDADGALRLAGLPATVDPLPGALATLGAAQSAGGIAVDADGSVYYSDPAGGTIRIVEGCFGGVGAVSCLGGQGGAPTQLAAPAGLGIAPHRHALYVADTGNRRVQVFDLASLALVEVIEGLASPTALALDDRGRLGVVDEGTRRVELFDESGDLVPAFGDMVAASGHAGDPCALDCEAERFYVLDRQTHEISVFSELALLEVVPTGIAGATSFAVAQGALYVGDPDRRCIAVWSRDQAGQFRPLGDAVGYEGPCCAITRDLGGGLLVAPGGGLAPIRLALDASHVHEGWLWSDAIFFDTLAHDWNRLHARIDLPAGSHVQFFVAIGPRAAPPPAPGSDGSFAAPWREVPADVTDFFLDLAAAGKQEALWIGARFGNDQRSTPVLSQLRVDFDQAGYQDDLPAVYRNPIDGDNFLRRYLGLFESFFGELEDTIADLPALLDPASTPAQDLGWLAGFLALPLSDSQSTGAQRAAVAGAFARYARRGTAAGLRQTLLDEAGVRALIDEPSQALAWWGLPAPSTSCLPGDAGTWADGGDSVLGFNTVLAAGEPQGAVVGTTAVFDRSQLIAQEEWGTPLFEGSAYRFLVRLYPGDLHCVGKLAEVRAIVEREKPAHTLYDLCVIESGLRVGYQACLGVDTLLGGGPVEPGRLGDGDLVLGGQPRARLGVDSRVGAGAQL